MAKEKKEDRKPTYLEQLQNLRDEGNSVAQQKINDYFWPKKKRADRKKGKRKRNYDD